MGQSFIYIIFCFIGSNSFKIFFILFKNFSFYSKSFDPKDNSSNILQVTFFWVYSICNPISSLPLIDFIVFYASFKSCN